MRQFLRENSGNQVACDRCGTPVILNPQVTVGTSAQFSLHLDSFSLSPSYVSSYVPNPDFATVTYKFSKPTTISGVEVVQHVFGVTRLEGFLGNDIGSLTSLGSVFGPSGDVVGGFVVPYDGVSQVFKFGAPTVTGAVFQMTVRKTPYYNAFAIHRAFPLDAEGNRILGAEAVLNTPPTVSCPAPAVLEAQSIAGTAATVTTTVSDADGDALLLIWTVNDQSVQTDTVPAGAATTATAVTLTATFPLGTNSVDASVTDGQNAAVSCATSIIVRDTTPPETFILEAKDGFGTIVPSGGSTLSTDLTIGIRGTDAVGIAGFLYSLDGGPFSSCIDPIKLTSLLRGPHSISVVSFDTSGNFDATPAVLNWIGLTPQQAAANLITSIGQLAAGGIINQGQATSLETKLQAAINQLNGGNLNAAVNPFSAFINQVNALVSSGRLSASIGQSLITAVRNIQSVLP